MTKPPARFPGSYVVRDANGQAIAYLYSRENEAEARQAKVLTADEARRIATNIARLRAASLSALVFGLFLRETSDDERAASRRTRSRRQGT
jgi:hypothetical protein